MPMRMRNNSLQYIYFLVSHLLLHNHQTSQNSRQPLWNMKEYLTPNLPSFRIYSKLHVFIWVFSN